jgi:flagellar basal-body rod protein FlgG
MITAFYTAATGAVQLQKGLDVTANNVANVSSTGYKASQSTFADLVYTNIDAPQGSNSDLKSGHGVKLDKTSTLLSQGGLEQTGRSLDYAVTADNGFFAVQKGNTVEFTKNGDFHLSTVDGKNYLSTSDGGLVLDSKGQPITAVNEQDNLDVGVYTFSNCDALERVGDTSFTATDGSGAAQAVTSPEIKKGWLEGSNVNMADEMVSVMELQRAFQMNSKIIQISDEISQNINSLR